MSFDAEHLLKPFTKLKKATRDRRQLGDPEHVHKLRTNTRRVEAILGALQFEAPGRKRHLLKSLTKIRRAAGDVRDMDVLTGKAASVAVSGEQNCQVQLLLHLGAERQKKAKRLELLLEVHGRPVRRELKRCADQVEPLLTTEAGTEQQKEEALAAARALELSSQLQRFSALGRRNLHDFRKEGKQLRYVLQMAKPQDEKLLDGLRDMQDAIGEWHDWEELLGIARAVLVHGEKCGLLRELQKHTQDAYDHALSVANAMRKRFFTTGEKRRHGSAPLRIVRASAALAA